MKTIQLIEILQAYSIGNYLLLQINNPNNAHIEFPDKVFEFILE